MSGIEQVAAQIGFDRRLEFILLNLVANYVAVVSQYDWFYLGFGGHYKAWVA